MKRIKSVNGYVIYEATSARDEANYNCGIGHYNLYLSSDIKDFGLSNSYPDWEDIETMSEAVARANGSQFAVATAMAWELSDSTIEDVALRDEIERRLEAGQPMDYIRDHYDTENGCFVPDWMDEKPERAQNSAEQDEHYELDIPEGKAAFYFTSDANPWMGMVIVVDRDKLHEAEKLACDGLTAFYEELGDVDLCFDDYVEQALREAGVDYSVVYPDDCSGDELSDTWEAFASQFETVVYPWAATEPEQDEPEYTHYGVTEHDGDCY